MVESARVAIGQLFFKVPDLMFKVALDVKMAGS